MTEDQTAAFVAAVNAAGADLTPAERAALLSGIFTDAAEKAWGAQSAAHRVYMVALALAKRAGIDPPTGPFH